MTSAESHQGPPQQDKSISLCCVFSVYNELCLATEFRREKPDLLLAPHTAPT